MDDSFKVQFMLSHGRTPLPPKLWQAVHDSSTTQNGIFQWSEDGLYFTVSESDFENSVLSLYPGLMKSNSFVKFKRLLNTYNFVGELLVDTPTAEIWKFCHSNFQKAHPEKLIEIQRRSKDGTLHPEPCNLMPSATLPRTPQKLAALTMPPTAIGSPDLASPGRLSAISNFSIKLTRYESGAARTIEFHSQPTDSYLAETEEMKRETWYIHCKPYEPLELDEYNTSTFRCSEPVKILFCPDPYLSQALDDVRDCIDQLCMDRSTTLTEVDDFCDNWQQECEKSYSVL